MGQRVRQQVRQRVGEIDCVGSSRKEEGEHNA